MIPHTDIHPHPSQARFDVLAQAGAPRQEA